MGLYEQEIKSKVLLDQNEISIFADSLLYIITSGKYVRSTRKEMGLYEQIRKLKVLLDLNEISIFADSLLYIYMSWCKRSVQDNENNKRENIKRTRKELRIYEQVKRELIRIGQKRIKTVSRLRYKIDIVADSLLSYIYLELVEALPQFTFPRNGPQTPIYTKYPSLLGGQRRRL